MTNKAGVAAVAATNDVVVVCMTSAEDCLSLLMCHFRASVATDVAGADGLPNFCFDYVNAAPLQTLRPMQ